MMTLAHRPIALSGPLCLGILTVLVCCLISNRAISGSPTDAANAFIKTLSGDEKQAVQPFSSPDRENVRLTPGTRLGLTLGAMDPDTRTSAIAFLRSLLSGKGYQMIETVRDREARLAKIEGNPDYRDKDAYALAVFGSPGSNQWAVRFEGHHLSINLMLTGNRINSVMPFLIGANPRKGAPDDILLPFLQSAENADAFARELATLFPDGTTIPTAVQMDVDLSESFFGGHPHLVVTPR